MESHDRTAIIHPFGFNASEKEIEALPNLYLHESDFNRKALDPSVSIIIGRRGTGKTALSQYLRFEQANPYRTYVDIDEPSLFAKVLDQVGNQRQTSPVTIIENTASIWQFCFWTSLMMEMVGDSKLAGNGLLSNIDKYLREIGVRSSKKAEIGRAVFHALIQLTSDTAGTLLEVAFKVQEVLNSPSFEDARASVISYLDRGNKAVIVIDTLEINEVRKSEMQQALGGMLQAVTRFALGSVHPNLHIKCFLPAEVYPYLTESVIPNIGKTLEFPVYLHWKPKDLLRLVCKRFHAHLQECRPQDARRIGEVDWSDFNSVKNRIWDSFFPQRIQNQCGVDEDSFQYVVRHTQLRPRQFIWLCNSIAQASHERGTFPHFTRDDVIHGVWNVEHLIAAEVLNSYGTVYPRAKDILACFRGQGNYFSRASELDRLAARTKNAWDESIMAYDRFLFSQMSCEIGIVGTITGSTDLYYRTEFEYVMPDRLILHHDEPCVIHPMFYKFYRIKPHGKRMVYPIGPDVLEL